MLLNDLNPTLQLDTHQVLKTLLYADVFGYPLSAQEVFERCQVVDIQHIEQLLRQLVEQQYLYEFEGYYTLQNNAEVIRKRLEGNRLATKNLRIARFVSQILGQIPFVEGVMLSGSISKNWMDAHSDIDYLIVTTPGRLWVARLWVVFLHKIIFVGHSKWLCYNYMIDSDHLFFKKQHLFNAIEIRTLIPTYNGEMYQKLQQSNVWTGAYFPHLPHRAYKEVSAQQTWLKRLLQWCLRGALGERLDVMVWKKTEQSWRRKNNVALFENPDQLLNIERHVAKAHRLGNHQKIMTIFHQKIADFERQFNVSLRNE